MTALARRYCRLAARLGRLSPIASTIPLFALVAWAPDSGAQTQTSVGVPDQGHGSVALTYQDGIINERTIPRIAGGGLQDFGEITRRTMFLEFDYGLMDGIALNVSLPFRSNRYSGNFPHDPRTLINDHGQRFLDDGEYHSNWGDWGAGLRWQWLAEPVAITPFVSVYVPSHNYPLFTETQAGTRQWQLDLGLNAGHRFGTSNFYWQAGYAYSFMEETKPEGFPARRVNHSTVNVELGWMTSAELTLRSNFSYRNTHNGLEFPDQFSPPPLTERDDLFYYHDQLFKWEGTTASLGANYRIDERYAVSVDYGRSLHVVWGHKYKHAFTVGISRAF